MDLQRKWQPVDESGVGGWGVGGFSDRAQSSQIALMLTKQNVRLKILVGDNFSESIQMLILIQTAAPMLQKAAESCGLIIANPKNKQQQQT